MNGQGFRMFVGDIYARTLEEALPYRQLTYTCLQDMSTRWPETKSFPTKPCPAGIMANVRFPTSVFLSYNSSSKLNSSGVQVLIS